MRANDPIPPYGLATPHALLYAPCSRRDVCRLRVALRRPPRPVRVVSNPSHAALEFRGLSVRLIGMAGVADRRKH